jgi:hypothetical protein
MMLWGQCVDEDIDEIHVVINLGDDVSEISEQCVGDNTLFEGALLTIMVSRP